MTIRTFALAGVVAAALAAVYVALFLQAARQSAGARVAAERYPDEGDDGLLPADPYPWLSGLEMDSGGSSWPDALNRDGWTLS